MDNSTIHFGPFQLQPESGRLLRDGSPVALGHRALVLLQALAEAKGQIVAKVNLMERVWPGQFVEEGNLTVQIAALRKAMGADSEGRDFIVTVPREGYRLIVGEARPTALTPVSVLPSLAVLPFKNLSSDAEQDYFADGITEDIITALSRFRSFAVIARNSSFVYKGRAIDVRLAAKELGVRYMLEGSVRRAGDKLRINAHLVDGTTGAHLWAQNFDGTVEEIFDVQDRITEEVVALVEPKIQRAEIERARRERPESLDAYDLYLRSLGDVFASRPEANARAIMLLERAITLDPAFAPAVAMAAEAYLMRIVMQFDGAGSEDRERAIYHARAALALTRDDPIVIAYSGFVLLQIAGEYDSGLAMLRLALSDNPNSSATLVCAGVGALMAGDLTEAADILQRGLRLDPGGLSTHWQLTGMAHIRLVEGRYEEALNWALRSQAVNAGYDANHWMLIAANAYLGRTEEAKKYISALEKISPGISLARIRRGQKPRDPHRIDVLIKGMRLAGLREA